MASEPSNFDIGKELGAIHAKLDQINKHSSRLMFAMLGIIAATLGVRFINSPPWTIGFAYISFFTAVVLVSSVLFYWRRIGWPRAIVRIGFAAFMLFSVLVRIFIFESGITKAPIWYAPIIDIFFILLGILLVLSAYKDQRY